MENSGQSSYLFLLAVFAMGLPIYVCACVTGYAAGRCHTKQVYIGRADKEVYVPTEADTQNDTTKTRQRSTKTKQEDNDLTLDRIYFSQWGDCYHLTPHCQGLRDARSVADRRICAFCEKANR